MENSLNLEENSESIQLRNRDPPRHEALSPSRHATAVREIHGFSLWTQWTLPFQALPCVRED